MNLVLVDALKSVPEAEAVNFFALRQKLYNFVSGSCIHLKWLAVQKELYPQQQPRVLQRLTDVSWA